jgi:hypothetical protein
VNAVLTAGQRWLLWGYGSLGLGLVWQAVAGGPQMVAVPAGVEQVLFGQWQIVPDGQVHCPRCGTTDVKRKGNKPRLKQYYNESGQLQEVAVRRYFCNNSRCAVHTFSDLPAGLVPYSRYRAEVHLLALQLYAWATVATAVPAPPSTSPV